MLYHKRGLTLIEIMVSLVVLSIIFTGGIKALQLTARMQVKSENLAQSSQILSDVSEKIINMRNTAFDFIVTGMTFNAANVPALSQLNNATITVTVVPYKDKLGVDIPEIKKVTIQLNWTSHLDGVAMNDTFTTLLSEPPTS
jgi:prepilin-type N-terminal cleavage/methylation domain-containing protein